MMTNRSNPQPACFDGLAAVVSNFRGSCLTVGADLSKHPQAHPQKPSLGDPFFIPTHSLPAGPSSGTPFRFVTRTRTMHNFARRKITGQERSLLFVPSLAAAHHPKR